MSAVHGKDTRITYAAQDLSAYINKAGAQQDADTAEVSVFGVSSKKYIGGLKDGTSSLDGPFDSALHAILAPLLGTTNAYVYMPAGSTTTKPRATVQAILTKYEVASDVNGAATITGELQFTGDVVWDTVP